MATQMKIDWIHKGFEEILCSPGADDACRQQAVRMQSAANAANRYGGDGFEVHKEIVFRFGSRRVEWFVKAADNKARMAEAEDKVLSRTVHA